METHDFTSAKVGDKVSHPTYGNGVIYKIDDKLEYQIFVKFNHSDATFTTDGKYHIDDIITTLYHGHNDFQIIATPKSPYKKDEWIAASHDGKYWFIEKFIGMDGSFVKSIDVNGESETFQYHKSLSDLNKELNNIEP